jgi:alpha-tubulin suppressor-like RCC1 family protein
MQSVYVRRLGLILACLSASLVAAPARTAPAVALGEIGLFADDGIIGCGFSLRNLWCWGPLYGGDLQVGVPAVRSMARHVRRPDRADGEFVDPILVAAAYNRACVIDRDGLWCWGANAKGQLGTGDRLNRDAPVRVPGLPEDLIGVELGQSHTCAFTAASGVWCWGSNNFGEAGQPPGPLVTPPTGGPAEALPLLAPQRVPLLGAVTALALGEQSSCALSSGQVWCWGRNDQGQLGDGSTTSRATPARIPTLPDGFNKLESAAFHSCAANGQGVWCWGNNSSAQLGVAPVTGRLFEVIPVPVPTLGAVSAMQLEFSGSCVSANGERRCWGRDVDGNALGPQPVAVAKPVGAPGNWAGGCFRDGTQGGELRCRGNGVRFPNTELDARQIPGLQGQVLEVDLGWDFGCARLQDGSIWCWGDNSSAQLGQGDTLPRGVAVRVPVPASLGLAVGTAHACSMTSDSLWCWGANSSGALGTGSTAVVLSPVRARWFGRRVAAGRSFTCIIDDSTGQVRCWGRNEFAQLNGLGGVNEVALEPVSPALSGPASEISAGDAHVCARIGGGASASVECWGLATLTSQDLAGAWTGQVRTIGTGATFGAAPSLRSARGITCVGDLCFGSSYLPPDRGAGRVGQPFAPPLGSRNQWAVGGRHHCIVNDGSMVLCANLVSRACTYEQFFGPTLPPSWAAGCFFGESLLGAEAKSWLPVRGLPGRPRLLAADHQYACSVVDQGVWCWGYSGALAPREPSTAHSRVFREGAIEPTAMVPVVPDPTRGCPAYLVSSVSLMNPNTADAAGSWGQEILLQGGRTFLNGGLNFGGFGSAAGRGVPGYAAFSTANPSVSDQRVVLDLRGDGGRFELVVGSLIPPSTERIDVYREEVTLGAAPTRRTLVLRSGFHVVSLLPREGVRLFLAEIGTTKVDGSAAAFAAGAVVGGYLTGNQSGFAGICTDDASALRIRTEARTNRGPTGAGDLRVRLFEGQTGNLLYDNLGP